MCDVAEVLLFEQVERDTLAERHVAAVMLAAGAKDVQLPTVDEATRRLRAALEGEQPKGLDEFDRLLREVSGA